MTNLEDCFLARTGLSTALALIVSVAGAGCGGSAQGTGSSGTPKAQPTSGPTVAVTNADKPASSSAPVDAPAPRSTSPFHIVADVDYTLELYRVGKTAVFVADGQLLPIQGNTVTFDPKFALSKEILGDGVTGAFQFLLGDYPNELFASVVRPLGRTGFTEIYKWSGTKWATNYSTDATTFVLDIQPWQNGTVLMVEAHSFSGAYRFSVLPKSSKVFIPEPQNRKWSGGAIIACELGFVPDALRTLPSGHAFMTGTVCSENGGPHDGQTAVKRWSPTNPRGTVDVLPEMEKRAFTLVNLALHGENDAYVAANTSPLRYGPNRELAPYLAHFDGKAWTRDSLPFDGAIASLDIDSNGKLWIVSAHGAVFARPAGGAWAAITLPKGGKDESSIEASAVWIRAPGDEWILGSYPSRSVVLHSGLAGEMAKLPDLETMSDAVNELAMPTPFTSRCSTPFVLLYTLSKVAPPDFDYPATREALKGHTEFEGAQFIEFKRLDKRYMGAFVPDADMGKKLVDFVTKKVPNSTPQLACHAPKPSRVIEIDLSKGN